MVRVLQGQLFDETYRGDERWDGIGFERVSLHNVVIFSDIAPVRLADDCRH